MTMIQNINPMEKILVPNLTKLQKDSAGRYGNPAVRQACDDALATLSTLNGNADGAFPALQAACVSKIPKLAATALDCTEKLMSRGFLANTPESNSKVIRVVAACSEIMNDDVQLQVVKALLIAVSNRSLPTHEASLLASIRACYHIHLVSPSLINKSTSKLALSQMMAYVFSDLEESLPPQRKSNLAVSSSPPPPPPLGGSDVVAPVPPPLLGQGIYPIVEAQLGIRGGPPNTTTTALLPPPPRPLPSSKPSSSDHHAVITLEGEITTDSARNFSFSSLAEKDAFLVLRTLSRLAMKAMSFSDVTDSGEEGRADPMAVKSKLVSLELLLGILESAGPKFKTSDVIVYALKQYLVPALMKNCMELNASVAQLSMTIFVAMQRRFKDQLKKEVELFYADVFLGLLESPNAQFESRLAVLETLSKMCGDIHQLVETFLNYDCDLKSKDLLADICKSLSRASTFGLTGKVGVATSTHVGNGSIPLPAPTIIPTTTRASEDRRLRLTAVNCLSLLVRSLVSYNDAPEDDVGVGVATQTQSPTHTGTTTTATTTTQDNNHEDTPPDPSSSTSTSLAEKIRLASAALDSFQQKQTWRKDLETAVTKFNVKPKTGILYLIERGHLDGSPKSTAKFLLDYQDVLSKSMIGDYLGDVDPKNVETLDAYVDMLQFKGLVFDEAIRLFLTGFRIPGEAQKIDRIMEKFASRYWNQNPDALPSADTAFILAFAIIMLHTDAHNPNIKPEKKMSKLSFLKQNRGIAAGRDLAPEFLGGIYDRIVSRAMVLKDDVDFKDGSSPQNNRELDARSKRKAFLKERAEILNDAETKRQGEARRVGAAGQDDGTAVGTPFYMVESTFNNRRHVSPMFRIIWLPASAAFVTNFAVEAHAFGGSNSSTGDVNGTGTGDLNLATACVSGIVDMCKVAAVYDMDDERDALLGMLCGLTGITAPWEMKTPHFVAIKSMLGLIAGPERSLLKTGWALALQCVSEVMRLLLMSKDGIDDGVMVMMAPPLSLLPPSSPRGSSSSSTVPPSPLHSSTPGKKFLHEMRRKATVNVSMQLRTVLDRATVERIFVDSPSLSDEAIVYFCDALVAVSRVELLLPPAPTTLQQLTTSDSVTMTIINKSLPNLLPSQSELPRIFSLQKLVEVADFNMSTRSRLVWGKMWAGMSEHFVVAGTHSSQDVGQYAVDSLRQLSIKFLDKDEFVGFAFQERFLRPFELIVKYSPSTDVRALCLMCTQSVVATKSRNIKSGWEAVFDVVTASCKDSVASNVISGFHLLALAHKNHAPPHLVARCALRFASCSDQDTCLQALPLVTEFCAFALLDGKGKEDDTELIERAKETLRLLAEFVASDPRPVMRNRALKLVFDVLRQGIYDGANLDTVGFALTHLVFPSWHDARTNGGGGSDGASKLLTLVHDPNKELESTLAIGFAETTRLLLLMCGKEISGQFGRTLHHSNVVAVVAASTPEEEIVVVEQTVSIGRNNKEYGVAAHHVALGGLFDHVIDLYKDVACRNLSYLANIGVAALEHVLDLLMRYLDSRAWMSLLDVLEAILIKSRPTFSQEEIATVEEENVGTIATRLNTCLGVLKLLKRVVEYVSVNKTLTEEGITTRVVNLLEVGFQSTCEFNDDTSLRMELSSRGMRVTDCIVHEVMTGFTLLRYLGAHYDGERLNRVLVMVLSRFVRVARLASREYKQTASSPPVVVYGDPIPGGVTFSTTFLPHTSTDHNNINGIVKSDPVRETNSLHPVVMLALNMLLEFPANSVQSTYAMKAVAKTLLMELVECDSASVRNMVRKILEKHVVTRCGF